MKLKFFVPPKKIKKVKPIDKNKIIRMALRIAAEQLYVDGNYSSPQSARFSLLNKAKTRLSKYIKS